MQEITQNTRAAKPYGQLTITDDFMFRKVMRHPGRCKRLLEILLNMKIRELVYVEDEKTIDLDYEKRGIRLDIYVEDEAHTVYNVEMQVENTGQLPKRSRYYQGLIDMSILEKGMPPQNLKKSLVIFICTFDLFGRGSYVYTFENRCRQHPELALGDGTEKLFINTKGRNHNMTDEFVALMEYFNSGKATDDFTREVQEAVDNIKNKVDLRVGYKSWNFTKAELLEEGIGIGQEEKLIRLVCRKHARGCSIEETAGMLEEEPDTIRRIYAAAEKYAPDYDVHKIYEVLHSET